MSEQQSLLDEIPTLPNAQIDFLAGWLTYTAFGGKSTKVQRERAKLLAEDFARAIVAMRTASEKLDSEVEA